MFLKNISLVPVRVTTPAGSVVISPNHWENVELHYCNNAKLIEVDADGNPKSGRAKTLVTENDKRTVAADLNVTAAPLVEDKEESKALQAPVITEVAVEPVKPGPVEKSKTDPVMMTTENVFKSTQRAGRPKKL